MFKRAKLNIFLISLIVAAAILLANNLLNYALFAFSAAVIVYVLWNIFLKNKESEISSLRKNIADSKKSINILQQENLDLRERRLNVTDIEHIIELSLIEINTSFTKTYNEEFEKEANKYKFIGALNVKIKAKYGIDLNELKLFFPKDENIVKVANITPKFLSFSSRKFKWELSEMMQYKEKMFGSSHWKSISSNDINVNEFLEEKRQKLEDEVENGPEELEWIMEPLKKQIVASLEMLLETSGRQVILVDKYDSKFETLKELKS